LYLAVEDIDDLANDCQVRDWLIQKSAGMTCSLSEHKCRMIESLKAIGDLCSMMRARYVTLDRINSLATRLRASVKKRAKEITSATLLLAGFIFLYRDVVVKLAHDWVTDDNYSHGLLIVPIALFFLWKRRPQLMHGVREPSNVGIVIILASLAVLYIGLLGSELFLTRISVLGILSGSILFVYGWRYLRVLTFPLTFLVFMIPIPRIVFDQVVFPLQLLASQLAEITLSALGIPVLREGNLIVLADSTLEVAEACSGLRSLVSLLALAVGYGYMVDPRTSVRIALAVGIVPVAIVANGFRISGTGLAAQYYGAEAAEAFFHAFAGWILFTIALVLLFTLHRILVCIFPLKQWPTHEPANEVKERALEYSVAARLMIITVALVVAAICIGLSSKTEKVPLRESFAGLSLQLGEWKGKPTMKLDDRILAKLGVDEYVNRFYYKSNRRALHLYVGYYQSQRQGNTIHSPKNCLPGAGWQPVESGHLLIPVEGHEAIKVNRYVVQKGMEKELVLYWYQSHGRVIASEYWAKVYLVIDAIRMNRTDGALVRVISPISDSETKAEQQVIDFTKSLFPLLNRHLPA
jgi:exosortase D (VPLPA-CTERM-specific)